MAAHGTTSGQHHVRAATLGAGFEGASSEEGKKGGRERDQPRSARAGDSASLQVLNETLTVLRVQPRCRLDTADQVLPCRLCEQRDDHL
jgi:hypothetical protein